MTDQVFGDFDFTSPIEGSGSQEVSDTQGQVFGDFDFTAPVGDEAEPSPVPVNLSHLVLPEDGLVSDEGEPFGQLRKIPEGQLLKFGGGLVKTGQGVKQATLEALEEFGFVDEGTADSYTKLSEEERGKINQAFNDEFGSRGIFTVADIAGQAAPFGALPGGGSTATARTVLGALSGATAGGLTFTQEDESRFANTALGATFGAILSPLMETVPAVKSFFKKFIGIPGKPKKPSDITLFKQRSDFIDEGLKITDDTGVEFKLTQLTGDPATESVEAFARAGIKGERLAREKEGNQVVQLLKFFKRTLTGLERKPSIVSGQRIEFGERVKGAFDNVLGSPSRNTGLLGARARNAKANFAAVNESIGEKGTIPVPAFRQELSTIIERNSQRGATKPQQQMASELQGVLDDFDDGVMNPSELQNLLSNYGDASSGSGRIFSDSVDNAKDLFVSKSLFNSLVDDIDNAVNLGNVGAADLKIARDAYLRDTAAINEVRNTALGRLFNKNMDSSPAAIKDAFLKMKAPDIKASMQILSRTDPHIARGAQREFLSDFIKKARVPEAGDVISFSPSKMLDIVKDRERFAAMFPDVKSRKLVMRGIEAARRIMINNSRTGGRSLPRAKEIAGVIASRDKTFVARLAADLLGPDSVARSVLSKEGVRGLELLATPYNQNRWAAGLVAISNALRDTEINETGGNESEAQ